MFTGRRAGSARGFRKPAAALRALLASCPRDGPFALSFKAFATGAGARRASAGATVFKQCAVAKQPLFPVRKHSHANLAPNPVARLPSGGSGSGGEGPPQASRTRESSRLAVGDAPRSGEDRLRRGRTGRAKKEPHGRTARGRPRRTCRRASQPHAASVTSRTGSQARGRNSANSASPAIRGVSLRGSPTATERRLSGRQTVFGSQMRQPQSWPMSPPTAMQAEGSTKSLQSEQRRPSAPASW